MAKHGAPDWAKYRPTSVTFPVQDLAELAARLESINTFDRRGDVVWVDNFSHGLTKWDTGTDGAGAAIIASPNRFLSKGYSAQLTCGSDGTRLAFLRSYKPYPRTHPIALETSFTIEMNHDNFTVYVHVVAAGTRHLYQLKWVEANSTLYYFSTAGTPIALSPTIQLLDDPTCFHTLKMVFDPTEALYTRAILNHQEWDLSDFSPYTAPQLGDPYLALFIQYQGDAGTNPIGYIDNVILTQDEP